MTTMREFVDSRQGEGTWDRMHDCIDGKELFGWSMPSIDVDGETVRIFPGTDRDVTLGQVQNEIRKALKAISEGDYEEITDLDD